MPDSEVNQVVVPVRHRTIINLPPPSAMSAGYQPTVEQSGDPIEVPAEYLDLADEVKRLLGYFEGYADNWRQESPLGKRIISLKKTYEALG